MFKKEIPEALQVDEEKGLPDEGPRFLEHTSVMWGQNAHLQEKHCWKGLQG